MVIAEDGRYRIIDYREIRYIQGHGSYSTLYWHQNKTIVTRNLKQIEQSIHPNEEFIRIHQSYLININQIQEISITESYLRTTANETLSISRSYKKEVVSRLKAWFQWI